MHTTDLIKKLSTLEEIRKGVYFDPSSYSDPADHPRIEIDGVEVIVSKVRIPNDHTINIFDFEDSVYTLDFDCLPDTFTDDYFQSIGMDKLLYDTYYNTSASYELGDLELEFMNN